MLPILIYNRSSLWLRPYLTKLPPFIAAGCWFGRTVLVTYLIPVCLTDWLGTVVYSLCLFIASGFIGQSLIRRTKLGGPIIGIAVCLLVILLWCVTCYVFRVPSLLNALDPSYIPPREAYAGVDNGGVAYGVGGIFILFSIPIFVGYLGAVFALAGNDLVRALGKTEEPASPT